MRRMLLILALAGSIAAQETTTATTTTTTTASTTTDVAAAESAKETTGTLPRTSYEVRTQFTNVLRDHPPEVAKILKLDPSLLSNEQYLSAYPQLAEFVQKAPEVRRNPSFYLGDIAPNPPRRSAIDDIVEMMAVFGAFALAIFVLTWLVRTTIEQKRWNRLTRTQTEVHTKILDRFGSSEEVLEYIKSPAGSKFLESAPIPLHAEKPAHTGPHARISWSIQLGVIIAVASIGMLLVSARFTGESSEAMFALGAIAMSVGVGFIASAIVSLMLSKRLAADDAEAVR